jgi:hypothetical protein
MKNFIEFKENVGKHAQNNSQQIQEFSPLSSIDNSINIEINYYRAPLQNKLSEENKLSNVNENRKYNSSEIPEDVKKYRRDAANERERKRMRNINEAFNRLRTFLPATEDDSRQLSKFETLQFALSYISGLIEMLQ